MSHLHCSQQQPSPLSVRHEHYFSPICKPACSITDRCRKLIGVHAGVSPTAMSRPVQAVDDMVKASSPPSELVPRRQQDTSVVVQVFRIAMFGRTCAASVIGRGRCNLLQDIIHTIPIIRTEGDVDMDWWSGFDRVGWCREGFACCWLGVLHRAEVEDGFLAVMLL